MQSKYVISVLLARASAVAIPNGERNFAIRWDSTLSGKNGVGYATWTFMNGVVTGTNCVRDNLVCPPRGGFTADECKPIASGTYNPTGEPLAKPADPVDEPAEDGEAPAEDGEAPAEDGEAPAEDGEAPAEDGEAPAEDGEAPAEDGEAPAEDGEAPAEESEIPGPGERRRLEEVWIGDHSLNNIFWNDPWTSGDPPVTTDEMHGAVLDVEAGTLTGIYNGGEGGLRVGTITYTTADCPDADEPVGTPIEDGDAEYVVSWTSATNVEQVGYAEWNFLNGVLSGRTCYQRDNQNRDDLLCPPKGGFADEDCIPITQGTYSTDGFLTGKPSEDWQGIHTISNVYWSEEYTELRETGAGTTDYFYGGSLNTVEDPNTFTGIFNGGEDGNKVGTFSLSAPDCDVEEVVVAFVEGETGENGAPCREGEMGEEEEYQRCNANAAGYRYCCGTGSLEQPDPEADPEVVLEGSITSFCGDGQESIDETHGFTRGGIRYYHSCGAMKIMASAGSILAAAFMM